MSLEAFGEVLGVVKSSVHAYESGDNYPNPEALKKIAEIGKTTLDWLIAGDDISKTASQNGSLRFLQHGHSKEEEQEFETVANVASRLGVKLAEMSLMKVVIRDVVDFLKNNEIELTPDKLADLIEAVYEETSEAGEKQVNIGKLARYAKLIS